MKGIKVVFWVVIGGILILLACGEESKDGRSVKEIRPEDKRIADMIRTPISADGNADTVNVAKISFEQREFNFGTVKAGEIVEMDFVFTNSGRIPLLIADARSTCGCTVPEWPKDPIEPGDSGKITVKFNTTERHYEQNRPISLIANTYPRQTDIILKGYVEPN